MTSLFRVIQEEVEIMVWGKRRRYTGKFKFQVVLEVLRGNKSTGQIARAYGVHPITISNWKKEFFEEGPELFGGQGEVENEKRIGELERLIGQKEIEIALLKNFLAGGSLAGRKRSSWQINLRVNLELSKSSWYYAQRSKLSYEDKYRHLKAAFFSIARLHPEYGYRRVCSELKDRGYVINHKVVGLHSCWNLSVIRHIKAPRRSFVKRVLEDAGDSINLVASLDRISDFEVFYTDFTEIIYCYGKSIPYANN